jgi:PAS domain S-box-containing protein
MHSDHAFQCSHGILLVILSYTISVLGAYCALQWAALIPQARGWVLGGRVTGAAIAMGGGAIWSMHFIAMIACHLPVPVTYDVPLTLVSLVIAIVVTGIGLYVVAIAPSRPLRLVASGVVTGLGVAAMHYTGIAAMRLPVRMVFGTGLVAASIAIAIVAATAALWIAFRANGTLRRLLSSLVMGGAVCGMHYTGMAAVAFVPTGALDGTATTDVDPQGLALMVFGTTLLVLALLYTASRIGELERRTTYLNTLIEHSPIAIVALDPRHLVQLVNPAFERLFLYDKAELCGEDLDDYIVPLQPSVAAEMKDLTRRVLGGESVQITTTRRRKDGELVDIELHGVPLTEKGKLTGVYAMYRDITKQRRLEEQLRHSQKIEAIGTLAGGVAHDFNNLLTAILGYSDLLLAAAGPDSPLRGNLKEIRTAGQRAASLTQQLLAFSRRELAVMKVLDLTTVVADVEGMLRSLVGDSISLVTMRSRSAGHIRADRGQLEQILVNLVANARDAMPDGGNLAIDCIDVDLHDIKAADRAGLVPGRYVTLTVSDTGMGMDAETRARVFEPFFSTKEKGRGTGLGLSTVYGIVSQSGGHIRVDSEPGSGTSVRIWWPRVEEAISPPARVVKTRAAGGTETILLVEDQDTVRGFAKTVLTRGGYRVIEAAHGEQAMDVAKGTDEAIHLVLTDAVMPGMSLASLIAGLDVVQPNSKTLIMSGYTSEAVARRGISQSDIPFLQKPFTGSTLLSKVREVLDAT